MQNIKFRLDFSDLFLKQFEFEITKFQSTFYVSLPSKSLCLEICLTLYIKHTLFWHHCVQCCFAAES